MNPGLGGVTAWRQAGREIIDQMPTVMSRRGAEMWAWPGYTLFFLMVFAPGILMEVKGVLLAIVLVIIGIGSLVRMRLALHPAVILWDLIIIATGLIFMLRGAVLGAPGAMQVGTVYALWPFVFLLCIAGAARREVMLGLMRVVVFVTIPISLYCMIFVFTRPGFAILPSSFYFELYPIEKLGVTFMEEGYIVASVPSARLLPFLVPFLLAALLTWKKGHVQLPLSRVWLWSAFALGATVLLLGGKKIYFIILVLAPMVTAGFYGCLPPGYRRELRRSLVLWIGSLICVLVLAYAALVYFYGFQIGALLHHVMAGFDFSGGEISARVRGEQFRALLQDWSNSPLLGFGHGAAAKGSLRGAAYGQPWAYELTYVALLFHTGIIGILLYASALTWVIFMGMKVMRSGEGDWLYMPPVLVGVVCFLIANATNPFLEKFDALWVVFFPVILINRWLLEKCVLGRLTDTPPPRSHESPASAAQI